MSSRRGLFTLVVVSLITIGGLSSCTLIEKVNPPAAQPMVAAVSEPRAQSVGDVVSAEGTIVPYKHADLSSKVTARVQEIFVSEGDVVTAGEQLAALETRDLKQAVLQAEAGLKSVQAQLARTKAGSRPEEIASAQAAVAIAQAGEEAAQGAVDVAEGNLASAQATLSSAQASLNRLLAGATDREIQVAEKKVEHAKNELWALQKQRDASFNIVEGQIAAAETAVEIAQIQLEDVKAGARPEDIAISQAQVAHAEAGVQIAEAQLAQAKADADRAAAQTAQAQAQLELVKAGSRPEDIAVAEAAVAEAEARVAQAKDALEDATIRAPFDGTVGAILINEGELAYPQLPIIQFGDLTRLRVETEDLSEVDIGRVKVGQAVKVTIDALEGQDFAGKVARIAPVATERRGDKVYTVEVDLDAGLEAGLRWGMSAFVEIEMR